MQLQAEPATIPIPKVRKVEKWELAVPRREGFGDWMRLTWDRQGVVSIVSDYGDWSHCWPKGHRGESLVRFLAGLDWHYCGKKMMGRDPSVFDADATIEAVRRHILERRHEDGPFADWKLAEKQSHNDACCLGPVPMREHGWTKERARQEFDAASIIADEGFEVWCARETSIEFAYEFATTRPDPQWVNLWTRLWLPYVRPALRAMFDDPEQREL